MKLRHREPFSYLSDASMPRLEGSGPVVFMDGDCVLCSRTARIIARLDHTQEFRICPTQSPLGQAMLRHYGLDPASPDSWLYLADGRAYVSLDAAMRAGRRLGGFARLLSVFAILPAFAQDWLYRRIALNRYALFGRTGMCLIPDPALRQRLIG